MGVDIVIPTKGNTDILFKCILSILNKTIDTPYHLYICDTGSSDKEIESIKLFLKDNFSTLQNATLLTFDYYNFAKINNHVIWNHCSADTVLLCNNDIELMDNCIDAMYEKLESSQEIGTVGCRLVFPTGAVQHAGQYAFLNNNGGLEVTHRGLQSRQKYKSGPVMGNTAALMMVRRQVFIELGMLNERYIECFEDVEFNMEAICVGLTNTYLDDVVATHHESLTRTKSQEAMKKLHHDYNTNLAPYFKSRSKVEVKRILSFDVSREMRDNSGSLVV